MTRGGRTNSKATSSTFVVFPQTVLAKRFVELCSKKVICVQVVAVGLVLPDDGGRTLAAFAA